MADLITTQGLTKRFGGLVAVNEVGLRIQEGEIAGVMGPNGSGKTTLFNLLSGLFSPSAGQINFPGEDITKVPPHKRVAMGMARTFQLVSVFDSLTAWENLVLSTTRFREGQRTVGNLFFAPARKKIILDGLPGNPGDCGIGRAGRKTHLRTLLRREKDARNRNCPFTPAQVASPG